MVGQRYRARYRIRTKVHFHVVLLAIQRVFFCAWTGKNTTNHDGSPLRNHQDKAGEKYPSPRSESSDTTMLFATRIAAKKKGKFGEYCRPVHKQKSVKKPKVRLSSMPDPPLRREAPVWHMTTALQTISPEQCTFNEGALIAHSTALRCTKKHSRHGEFPDSHGPPCLDSGIHASAQLLSRQSLKQIEIF